MTYTISSDFCTDMNKKPCAEAKKITIPLVERVGFSSIEEYNKCKNFAEPWEAKGTNHRVLFDNCIARDIDTVERWAVEFGTMEEFEQFLTNLHKNVVILTDYDNPDYFHIEICEEIYL